MALTQFFSTHAAPILTTIGALLPACFGQIVLKFRAGQRFSVALLCALLTWVVFLATDPFTPLSYFWGKIPVVILVLACCCLVWAIADASKGRNIAAYFLCFILIAVAATDYLSLKNHVFVVFQSKEPISKVSFEPPTTGAPLLSPRRGSYCMKLDKHEFEKSTDWFATVEFSNPHLTPINRISMMSGERSDMSNGFMMTYHVAE